jgi:eukaryotic-like serine/threonine-protein kinase
MDVIASDWSSDGRWIAFRGGNDLWIGSTSDHRTSFPFLRTTFNDHSPRFSPDSRWIAYVSDESGRSEVYVRSFAGRPAESETKIRISADGGDFPVWRRDGRELFFMSGNSKLYAANTEHLDQSGAVDPPSPLFAPCPDQLSAGLPLRNAPWSHPYDVSHDGQHFLVNCSLVAQARFAVIVNWAAVK